MKKREELIDATDKEIEEWCNEKYKDISEGSYDLSSDGIVLITGKQGFIESEITKLKFWRDFFNEGRKTKA